MNNRAVAGTAHVPRRFITFWLLSLLIPGLILMVLRGLILGYSTSALGYTVAVFAPAPVWLLIGFLQYRLLRPHLRTGLWWLLATFVGGILGMFVGGPAMVLMMPQGEVLVLSSQSTPEWMFAQFSLLPAAFGGAIATAILGLSQALSLGQGFRRGLLWLCTSVLSGALAAVCGGIAHLAYARTMSELNPAAVEANPAMQTMIALSIAMLAGMTVYGLVTGLVMRWLLVRRRIP
jgi:hypothetical protein